MVKFINQPNKVSRWHIEMDGGVEEYIATYHAILRLLSLVGDNLDITPTELYYISSLLEDMLPQPEQICT